MKRVIVVALLLSLAAVGQAQAQIDPALAESIAWYTGTTGRVDDDRARELLEQAQAGADTLSTMWLARVYSTGRMTFPQDPAQARAIAATVIDDVETQALSGAAEAQFLMGTAYAEGLGKAVDADAAMHWYRLAAAQNHILAQHNVGNAYRSGTGVAQSHAQAVYWWTLAAKQGDAIPQLRLGEAYESGRGVEKDRNEAIYWYQQAADRGNGDAQNALERLGE